MGCFSWIDCDRSRKRRKPIKIGEICYVLVPKEFGGGHICESYYDGYGHFGGQDIYELAADWNKGYLSKDNLRKAPVRKKFGGLWDFEKEALREQGVSEEEISKKDEEAREEYYQNALRCYQKSINKIEDFQAGLSDAEMTEKYGSEWKRNLGIDVACYDEQNAALKYPIKITHDYNGIYETCPASKSDPNQGCF